jgi:hypothetical protein
MSDLKREGLEYIPEINQVLSLKGENSSRCAVSEPTIHAPIFNTLTDGFFFDRGKLQLADFDYTSAPGIAILTNPMVTELDSTYSGNVTVHRIKAPNTLTKAQAAKYIPNIYLIKNSRFLVYILSSLIYIDINKHLLSKYIEPMLETLLEDDPEDHAIKDGLYKAYNNIEAFMEALEEDFYGSDRTLTEKGLLDSFVRFRGFKGTPRAWDLSADPLIKEIISRLQAGYDTKYTGGSPRGGAAPSLYYAMYPQLNSVYHNLVSPELHISSKYSDVPAKLPSPRTAEGESFLKKLYNIRKASFIQKFLQNILGRASNIGAALSYHQYSRNFPRIVALDNSASFNLKELVMYATIENGITPDLLKEIGAIIDRFRKYGVITELQKKSAEARDYEKTKSAALSKFVSSLGLSIAIDDTADPQIQRGIRSILKDVASKCSQIAKINVLETPEDTVLKALRVSEDQDEIMLEVVSGVQKCLELAGYSFEE